MKKVSKKKAVKRNVKKAVKEVEAVNNPTAKEHNGKYTLKVDMPKRDQVVLSYALFANKVRSMPTMKELQDNAHFLERVSENKMVEGKDGKKVKKKVNKVVKTSMRRDKWKSEFSSQDALHNAAMSDYPELMKRVVEPKVFIPKQIESLEKALQSARRKSSGIKRLLITCAVGDAPMHWGLYSAMKNYMDVVGDCMGIVMPANNNYTDIDHVFFRDEDFHVIFKDARVNSNLYLNNIKMNPKQKNPLTGLDTFVMHEDSSIVVGAPKIGWEPVSSSIEGGETKFKIATGAITKPHYVSKKYGQYRTDKIAEIDHELGFVLVELGPNDTFHHRCIEANSDGSFIDMGVLFKPSVEIKKDEDGDKYADMSSVKKMKITDRVQWIAPQSISLGDLHAYHVDKLILKKTLEVINKLEVSRVVLHDSIDFSTISHHTDKNTAEKAALDMIGQRDVADELTETARVINMIADQPKVEKVYEAFSNHDDFLQRCLESGRHLKDSQNNFVLSLLYPAAVLYQARLYKEVESVSNANPKKVKKFTRKEAEQVLLKRFGPHLTNWVKTQFPNLLDCKHPALISLEMFGLNNEKVKFFAPNEFLKIKGIYVNFHGNFYYAGVNRLKNVMKAVLGHTHKGLKTCGSKIYYSGVMKSAAKYALGGLPNWTNTHTMIYPTGQVQQLSIINGKWRLEDGVYDKLKKQLVKG
tara:strand:- start:7033 stop:9120 length:2088 start_codon:yes stop_codon:yes gene_type:complete